MPDPITATIGAVGSVGGSLVSGKMAGDAADVASDSAIAGSKVQADAYKYAADKQAEATANAIASTEKMYEQSRADLAPWRKAGENALGNLVQMVQVGPGEFVPEADPGYRFGYETFVEKPTLRTAAATGKLRSGATQKALTRYAQDYASTKHDNFLSRYYDRLVPLQTIAGLGSNATGAQVGANQNAGASISNALMTSGANQGNLIAAGGNAIGQGVYNAGQSRASGYINQGNAISGGVNNMANAFMMYKMMQ